MLVVGRRAIPWVLHYVAHTGSRELFRLAVLAIALGVACGAAQLFGVSLALGAFFAGMIMSESELSHRAAEESLPLRDAFSVLFLVSLVGNGTSAEVFAAANAAAARRLILAIPNAFEAGQIIQPARTANARITIIAWAHSDAEVEHLAGLGADAIIMGEREIARGIVEEVVRQEQRPERQPVFRRAGRH